MLYERNKLIYSRRLEGHDTCDITGPERPRWRSGPALGGVRSTIRRMPRIYLERREMGEELRRLFDMLDGEAKAAGPPGECNPAVDVLESPTTIEVIVDLPGLSRDEVQVVFTRGTLLVAGIKKPSVCAHSDAAFHLAERAFGRFARVVRIAGAVDAGRARATLSAGELRITVPRIDERRGREIRIPVETS
jgi:HSP20 family protein